jgi:hypothetical protein
MNRAILDTCDWLSAPCAEGRLVHQIPASCKTIAKAASRMHVKVELTACRLRLPTVGRQVGERDCKRVAFCLSLQGSTDLVGFLAACVSRWHLLQPG